MEKLTENSFPAYSEGGESLKWISSEPVLKLHTPIFDVTEVHRKSLSGKEGNFVVLEAPRWVTMVPVFTGTDGQKYFVLERQYRHGSDCVDIEFPAGIVEKGEDPEAAAVRELLEETGILAKKVTKLAELCSNAAFVHNTSTQFLMEDLELVSGQKLDPNEEIDILVMKAEEVVTRMGQGEFNNGMMMSALGSYLRLQHLEEKK